MDTKIKELFDKNSIDLSAFANYEKNIFLKDDISLKRKIFRYTSLSNLFSILGKDGTLGMFYISRKDNFKDRRERGEFYNKKYHLYKFYVANKKTPQSIMDKWDYNDAQIKAACQLYASCWTTRKVENALMWTAYADNYGIRISSSVGNLLNSLELNSCNVYCGKMIYGNEKPYYDVVDSMFYKTNYYEDEKELRFYIHDENKLMKKSGKGILVGVNAELLIEKITFSPYMPLYVIKSLKTYLEAVYPFLKGRIVTSHILEN